MSNLILQGKRKEDELQIRFEVDLIWGGGRVGGWGVSVLPEAGGPWRTGGEAQISVWH